MKVTNLSALAGAGGTLILAGSAHAAFAGVKVVLKPNATALTYNIYATFDQRPGDSVVAVAGTPLHPLNINVRGGTFYQNGFGTDRAPSSLLFPLFPSLQFDTF